MAASSIEDSVSLFTRRGMIRIVDSVIPLNPRPGRITCCHGEEEKWPPHKEATLGNANEMEVTMKKFYAEAVRRLPVDAIPELVDCICKAGHCIGLADPVSNIILNAISQLPSPSSSRVADSPPRKRMRSTSTQACEWGPLAYASNFGLLTFMAEYFKYLHEIQARRYLHAASYDLPVAIKLVRDDRFTFGSFPRHLLPDGGKMKAALRIAALKAGHPAPDDLAGLMTAQYPSRILSHIVFMLKGHKLLSPRDVWVMRKLLKRQWPATPLRNLDILSNPNGNACVKSSFDSILLLLSSCIGDDLRAQISMASQRHLDSLELRYMSDFTFHSEYVETKLSNTLEAATRMRADSTVDYDASRCKHILSLKMCLLDSIRALYIMVLSIVPISSRDSRFVRALLVAGHCYGPLDLVSNIILNALWYDLAFPLHEDHIETQGDILDTSIMCRLETRSLNGIVALFREVHGSCISEHEILEYLHFRKCDLTTLFFEAASKNATFADMANIAFVDVAKAAKHPQFVAFGSFLMSLSPEKLYHLNSLLCKSLGHTEWIDLKSVINSHIANNVVLSARTVDPFHMRQEVCLEISRKKSAFRDRLAFVRKELDKALHEYCNQHPGEPNYQLDIICGVHMESPSHNSPRFYHANFLASKVADNVDVTLPCSRKLFFAEFWELPWDPRPSRSIWYPGYAYPGGVPYSFSSSCCPIYDPECVGRCYDCEAASSRILHPPQGSHSGNNFHTIEQYQSLFDYAVRKVDNNGFEQLLESDYIYFDPDRDAELGKTMNHFQEQKQQYFTCMGSFQPVANC